MDATPPTFDTRGSSDGDVGIVELGATKRTAKRGATKSRTSKRSKPATRRTAAAREPGRGLHRLIARSELGRTGVVSAETPVGRLAVGISNGRPFAVSDTCRHLFASLGEGRVMRDGCLQCPWHRSRYDVTTGKMVRGPQGLLFLTAREIVRAYTNLLFPLKTYPVVERGGVLYLDTGS